MTRQTIRRIIWASRPGLLLLGVFLIGIVASSSVEDQWVALIVGVVCLFVYTETTRLAVEYEQGRAAERKHRDAEVAS